MTTLVADVPGLSAISEIIGQLQTIGSAPTAEIGSVLRDTSGRITTVVKAQVRPQDLLARGLTLGGALRPTTDDQRILIAAVLADLAAVGAQWDHRMAPFGKKLRASLAALGVVDQP